MTHDLYLETDCLLWKFANSHLSNNECTGNFGLFSATLKFILRLKEQFNILGLNQEDISISSHGSKGPIIHADWHDWQKQWFVTGNDINLTSALAYSTVLLSRHQTAGIKGLKYRKPLSHTNLQPISNHQ